MLRLCSHIKEEAEKHSNDGQFIEQYNTPSTSSVDVRPNFYPALAFLPNRYGYPIEQVLAAALCQPCFPDRVIPSEVRATRLRGHHKSKAYRNAYLNGNAKMKTITGRAVVPIGKGIGINGRSTSFRDTRTGWTNSSRAPIEVQHFVSTWAGRCFVPKKRASGTSWPRSALWAITSFVFQTFVVCHVPRESCCRNGCIALTKLPAICFQLSALRERALTLLKGVRRGGCSKMNCRLFF